jgi:import receptor subunit TOM20
MSGRSTTTTALTVAGASLVAGAVAYAAYFDYKRRTDAEFRRQLRERRPCRVQRVHTYLCIYTGKEKKKVEKTRASEASASVSSLGGDPTGSITVDNLRSALALIRAEPAPPTAEAKEAYFLDHVHRGEQLLTQGKHLPLCVTRRRADRSPQVRCTACQLR